MLFKFAMMNKVRVTLVVKHLPTDLSKVFDEIGLFDRKIPPP